MIEKQKIEALTQEFIENKGLFVVDIKVDNANNVSVTIDSMQGVDIETCVELSRHIEGAFDREVEDFSLEVSSPGIGLPFKVLQQYQKVLNKSVAVVLNDGKKLIGDLKKVTEQDIEICYKAKEKAEGQKRPQWVEKIEVLTFEQIKSTIELI